jgi:L-cysteine:1D-myo-inositol 2-amino-2-deoxy-alpha-D-glucopyranoside ligase
MRIYNTLSQAVEPFEPRDGQVTLYVCGVTPYDTTHLGHAFTYTSADILVRHLESQGLVVRYVQNVTDVDDDVLRRAREVGEDWRALGNRWTAHFIRDMLALNVRPPDEYPRATDVIPEIVSAVEALIERGLGYVSGGSVYYHVDAWPRFGQLSHLPRPEMLPVANERGNRPDDPHKRDPLDFVLWQAQAPGEPAWNSPWGPGRPGWHIECTVMSTRFLGPALDFHSGGGDLIFPHHECEIAQAEPLTGRTPFVRFWLHPAMVEYQGAKMSKSLGNLVMVRDLLRDWSPDAIRLYLGGHHYRQSWAHEPDELARAERLARKLRAAATAPRGRGERFDGAGAQAEFTAALDDDLDTRSAVGHLESLAEAMLAASEAQRETGPAQVALRRMAGVFGLRLDAPEVENRVTKGWTTHLERFTPATGA